MTSEVICDLLGGTYDGDEVDCPFVVAVEEGSDSPRAEPALSILQSPSSSTVTIRFQLLQEGRVTLDVFDSGGRRVHGLLSEYLPAGVHTTEWDTEVSTGSDLPTGVYFIRLCTSDGVHVRKAMVLH